MSNFDQLFVLGSVAFTFIAWMAVIGLVSFLLLLTPQNIRRFSRGTARIIRYLIMRAVGIGSDSALSFVLHK
ncbi:hypothetical protein ESZ50_07790 [Weissella muntiaci]|uniref:Uncharacterized protein n=1 Tax=Weissella muntiaci TaxID=2508881 RepID=A0A6C2C4B3_9LACO|nr:hypothetical protein [Weissella muntiaci]TYC48770.1 hypothetical protein ESZ50_07790 [Weissella muntiaci]